MKLIILTWLGAAWMASAATFYVATNGNNGNPGTIGSPWLTMQWGADHAGVGDTVIVNPGKYSEIVRFEIGQSNITMQSSSGSPSTWTGTNLAMADPATLVKPNGLDIRRTGITCDGFAFVDQSLAANKEIVRVTAAGSQFRLLNTLFTNFMDCKMVSFVNSGALPSGGPAQCTVSNANMINIGGFPFLVFGTSNLFISNRIDRTQTGSDAHRVFGAYNRLIGHRITHQGDFGGPNVDHPDLCQFFGNNGQSSFSNYFIGWFSADNNSQVCQSSQDGADIHDNYFINCIFNNHTGYAGSGASNMWWINCLFNHVNKNSGNCMATSDLTYGPGQSRGTKIINSVFFQSGADSSDPNYGWYSMYSNLALNGFIEFHHNAVIGSNYLAKTAAPPSDTVHWGSWGLETSSLNGGNPKFVSEGTYDFHLLSGSPLLGAGTNVSAITGITTDFDGTSWGSTWNIGPFASTNAAPPIPPVLYILMPCNFTP